MRSASGLKAKVRPLALRMLERSGCLSALHRVFDRQTLTVFGMHRVLDPSDPRFRLAIPEWTIQTRLFRELLEFVGRHYRVVSIDDVLDAAEGKRPLPACAALFTFDDGWASTADTALPILRAIGFPSLTFVVSGSVGAKLGFWESEWYAALVAAGPAERAHVFTRFLSGQPVPKCLNAAVGPLWRELYKVDLAERFRLLQELLGGPVCPGGPVMVTAEQIGEMIRGGMAVGAHGVSHEPLDVGLGGGEEIAQSIRDLDALARPSGGRVRTFSFPHGRYDARLATVARECGAELQFTSDTLITPTRGGFVDGRICGRVWFGERLMNGHGGLNRPVAAWDLFGHDHGFPSPPPRHGES